ncbi:putative RNA-dependent RNA polymerase 2 [Triangularia setosa]|uniref:RNA-dependent RNA polymerase n=1 Tax=Triangularia setosa TaxID=2587417 RepID=A0AAN6VYV2_9PEZI|nr:putative RNA-dependent RNA polymerase 2 [Podospora setosa]
MVIHPDRVEDIPDIETAGYIFTNGCGLTSPILVQELARRDRIVFRNSRYNPSVFQIRYCGYKGVIKVDPTMPRPTNNTAFKFLSYVNMPELAERVLIEDNLDQVQSKIKALVKAEYGKMLNKRDEQKYRILIPQSRLLFGVCDVWNVLKEGECAVKITLFEGGQPVVLKGMEVLVTRNPCLHPRDMQRFKVVEQPKLAHLTDCIVFSCRGRRPAADLMSWGDLDGDTCMDIIPSTMSKPAN